MGSRKYFLMKLLAIVLILSLTSLSLAIAHPRRKSLAQHGSLYYYHKFEHRHGWVPNSHVPLQQHYSNERHLRHKAFEVEDKINHLKRKEGFKLRDQERKNLAIKNELNVTTSSHHAEKRLHRQREQAIKEQINHQEKFREKYQARLLKNRKKVAHALPDQVPEYTALISFDKERENYFSKAEDAENQKLHHIRQEDLSHENAHRNKRAELKGELRKGESKLETIRDGFKFKLKQLEAEHAQLEGMITADEHLDAARRANEKKEAILSDFAQTKDAPTELGAKKGSHGAAKWR